MARKRTKFTALFSFVAILALAGMGLTYTLWSETLTINGTVNTGEVDVAISTVTTNETVGTPDGEVDEDDLPAAKGELTSCEAIASEVAGTSTPDNTDDEGNNHLEITVSGAYPSYHCYVTITITSTGTVPVHFEDPVAGAGDPAWVDASGCDLDPDVQLHQGDSIDCTILIHFDNADGVTENSSYTFSFSILAHQWNEEP